MEVINFTKAIKIAFSLFFIAFSCNTLLAFQFKPITPTTGATSLKTRHLLAATARADNSPSKLFSVSSVSEISTPRFSFSLRMAAGDTDAEGDDAGDNRASASSEDLIDQFSSNINATLNKIDPDNKYSGYFPTFVTVLTVGVLLFGGYSYAKDISTTAALASNGIANGAGLTTAEMFDPMRFQPVCPASDGIYQFLKGLVNAAIGDENVAQFGPLIASVLLRVRLELCVFESFIYEAVVPFIRARGLSWVLPLHETAETFIAGSVFAVASNFILVGSTKIFAVLMIYTDALLGTLFRAIGWSLDRIPLGKPTTEAVGRGFALVGGLISNVRKTVEVFDTFVGRYLVFATSLYVIIKFVHFKFFNYLF